MYISLALTRAVFAGGDPLAAVNPAACYPDNITDDVRQQILREYKALMPGSVETLLRVFTDPTAWVGEAQLGPSGQALPAHLTYSFPADGTLWGLAIAGPVGQSNLSTKFIALFGSGNLDQGREYLRQCMASWRRLSGLTYSQVDDDGSPQDMLTTRSATRGDLRIGGFVVDQSLYLAYNAFPAAGGVAVIGGGDMVINTGFFTYDYYDNPANNFRFLRNTISHEFGHSIGLLHTVPCTATKLMEPFITTGYDMQTVDEIRAVESNYGDRFTPNQTASQAHSFGDLSMPFARSVCEPLLSTNGANGPNGSGEDWFRFKLSTPRPVTISATPSGSAYTAGAQSTDCNTNAQFNINALGAGNLSLELRSSDGATLIASSGANGPGFGETVSFPSLAAGTYTVRVVDVGPNAPNNQNVQLYTLLINVDGTRLPPRAVAGVDKRAWANSKCYFIGDVNSWSTDVSAVISGYEWDLDGDGAFESLGAQVWTKYVSNGVYPVSLRVTDTNGLTGTDTINVTVFNAVATITGISAASITQGTSIPVTVTGTNFKGVNSADQLSASGAGVSFAGTPAVDALGTTISGLTLVAATNAGTGTRTISVTNSDGSSSASGNATSAALLTVVAAAPPQCPGDLNSDGQRNTIDLGMLLGMFGQAVPQGTSGDLNSDGVVNSLDLGVMMTVFGSACP